MKILKKHSLPLFVLVILSITSHAAWFSPDAILTNGDVWYLYKEAMQTFFEGTWTSFLSLGDVNVSYNLFFLTILWKFLASFGLGYQTANQLTYFFPIVFITPIAIYSCLYYITQHKTSSFVGSTFYIFTTIFLILQNGGLLQASAYAFLPLVFLFFIKYLDSYKLSDGLLFTLFFSLSLLYESRITYITLFVIVFYALFFFLKKYKKGFITPSVRLLLKSIPLIVATLLINAYSYLPLLLSRSLQESATSVTTRSLFGVDFFTLKEPMSTMHPFWTGKLPTEFIPQEIPIYFWIFPLFAFSALFFVKKDKMIFFFATVALVMIFLGKSAASPFGSVYTWLYYNFPGFGFFREPSKFWIMLAFAYSILIAFTLKYGSISMDRLKNEKIKSLAKIILIVPILLASLYTGKPAFTSELGPLFQPLKVTNEHFFLRDFLYDQKDFFRTYYTPGRYRMGFWSEIHPMLGLNEIPPYFQTLDNRILSILSAKYVIIPPDITKDVYRHWGSKEVYQQRVDDAPNLKRLTDPRFGNFAVYENNISPKPHIYTISNLIYVTGNPSNLPEILAVSDSKDPAFYFESPDYSGPNLQIKELLDKEKKENYKRSSENLMTIECIRCEDKDYRTGLVFPFPRFLPGSPIYEFVIRRENKRLESLNHNKLQKLQLAVFYGTKRMTEVQRMTDKNLPQHRIGRSLKEQDRILDIIESDISFLEKNQVDNNTLFGFFDYLDVQKDISNTILTSSRLDADNTHTLQNNYRKLTSILSRVKGIIWMSDISHDRYLLSVKKEGIYDIYINTDIQQHSTLNIDNANISLKKGEQGWIILEDYYLTEGLHRVSLVKNLENQERANFTKTILPGRGSEVIEIPIEQLEENTEYIVSFVYRATNSPNIRHFIDRDSDFEQNRIIRKTSDRFLKTDGKLHEISDNKFRSRFGEKKAVLKFIVEKDIKRDSVLEVEHLSARKNKGPIIIARKVNRVESTILPSVTFQWINPTKYIVSVENAVEPFYLVFSENFHTNWQAFYKTNNANLNKRIVKVHENGKIRELEGENSIELFNFLPINNKREEIPVHFALNGYTNSWFIEKKGNYTVEIEFEPQQKFMFSLFISLVSLVICLTWFIFLRRNEKKD